MRLIRREKETLSIKRMKNKENKINVRQGTDDAGKTSKQRKKTLRSTYDKADVVLYHQSGVTSFVLQYMIVSYH